LEDIPESTEEFISELKKTGLYDALGDGLSIQSTHFKILYQNKIHKERNGDHTGKYCYRAYAHQDNVCDECPVKMAFNDRQIHKTDKSYAIDKGLTTFEITASPLIDKNNNIIGGIEVMRDITECRRTEESIQNSENKYRILAENAPIGIFYCDFKGTFHYGNKKAEQIIGYPKEELIGKSFFEADLLSTEDLAKAAKMLALNALGKSTGPKELTLIRKDRKTRIVEINCDIVSVSGKKLVLGMVQDITERKHAEESVLNIARGVPSTVGAKFFNSLGQHLSNTLHADYAYLAELVPGNPNRVKTLSMVADGKIIDNIEIDLPGTPCEAVIGKKLQSYPSGVHRLFPKAHMMTRMKIEGYVGIPLFGLSGLSLGVMSVMYRNPLSDTVMIESILKIFASRASAEIERRQSEEVLKKNESRLAESQNIAHIGSWEYNTDTDELWWSDEIYRIYGLQNDINKISIDKFIHHIHPDDRDMLQDQLRSAVPYSLDYRIIRRDGSTRWIHEEVRVNKDIDGIPQLIWGTAQDITDRKRLEEQLQEAAITDDLTGLFNRRGFMALAKKQCKLANRNKNGLSLLFVDLDGMKIINDALGHKAGDQALIDTADVLSKTFRESDIIARMGGDEFAVLLTEPSPYDVENVIISHVEKNISLHNEKARRQYVLKVSIGLSHFDPAHPCSLDELMSRADSMMYKNKKLHSFDKRAESTFQERRAHTRFKPDHACIADISESGSVVIEDISMEGICLNSPLRMQINSTHNLRIIKTDHGAISQKGIVVWSTLIEKNSSSNKTYYQAGLRFLEMDQTTKSSLKAIISSLAH